MNQARNDGPQLSPCVKDPPICEPHKGYSILLALISATSSAVSTEPPWSPVSGPQGSLPHNWVTKVQLLCTSRLTVDIKKSSNC